jgi:hypothetical protein
MYIASCGSDKLIRIYERSSEILVLEDETEKEREVRVNKLVTNEISAVQGQKNQILPTHKTVNSEIAVSLIQQFYFKYNHLNVLHKLLKNAFNTLKAELILECLDICKIYKKDCSTVIPPNPLPPLPLLMQSYKCCSIEEFLLETIKRIRAR